MANIISGIVVARSRKNNGICLVIYETDRARFCRIISPKEDRVDGELKKYECTYQDGTMVQNLDVIEIGVKSFDYVDDECQKENIYYDENYKITKKGRVTKKELISLYGEENLSSSQEIFVNKYPTMKLGDAILANKSFMLAKVYGLEFYIVKQNGKDKCRCRFKYNYIQYENISVTISESKNLDIKLYAGKHYAVAIVCFSFGHEYEGNYYKYLCSFLGYSPYYVRG